MVVRGEKKSLGLSNASLQQHIFLSLPYHKAMLWQPILLYLTKIQGIQLVKAGVESGQKRYLPSKNICLKYKIFKFSLCGNNKR